MKIGFDIMGGDYAPKEAISGAVQAQAVIGSSGRIVLIGDEAEAKKLLQELQADESAFDFVHTTEVIGMGEHPTKAISQKKDSSISVGFKMLASKQLDAFVSAGNTGALLVGSMVSINPKECVIRPCMTSIIPN
ncbi:MAG: phosphate--acyl-ACP acyltransferase, partial [Bacteroidota bacterium]